MHYKIGFFEQYLSIYEYVTWYGYESQKSVYLHSMVIIILATIKTIHMNIDWQYWIFFKVIN